MTKAASDTSDIDLHVKVFARYKPGESFFVEGAKRVEWEYMRRYYRAAGLGVEFCEVECDTKYKKPGLRVYRREL